MQWTGRLIAPLTLVGVVVAGCGGETSMTNMQDVYRDVAALESSHHTAVTQSPTLAAGRTEMTRYAADMHALADRMQDACGCGPDVAMMPDGMGDIHRTMNGMVGMADRHVARAMADTSLAAMRAECIAHHDSMDAMMDSLGGMLGMMTPSRGMHRS